MHDENCGGTTGSNEGEEMISEPGYEQMGHCGAVSQTAWSQHMHDPSDWVYSSYITASTHSLLHVAL